jgi:hypothetical protein
MSTGRAILIVLAPACITAAVPYSPSDLGGSPVPVGAGARALGMGGAFTAIADDATAGTWNPGGMTQLERPEAAISGGYYGRRTAYAAGASYDAETDLDHVSLALPFTAGVPQTSGGLATAVRLHQEHVADPARGHRRFRRLPDQ